MASGYRPKIEKMQRDVLEYRTRHVSQPPGTESSPEPLRAGEQR
jgi:hypothetical protein